MYCVSGVNVSVKRALFRLPDKTWFPYTSVLRVLVENVVCGWLPIPRITQVRSYDTRYANSTGGEKQLGIVTREWCITSRSSLVVSLFNGHLIITEGYRKVWESCCFSSWRNDRLWVTTLSLYKFTLIRVGEFSY